MHAYPYNAYMMHECMCTYVRDRKSEMNKVINPRPKFRKPRICLLTYTSKSKRRAEIIFEVPTYSHCKILESLGNSLINSFFNKVQMLLKIYNNVSKSGFP